MKPPLFPPQKTARLSSIVVFAILALFWRPALSNSNEADRPIAWLPDAAPLGDMAADVGAFSPDTFARRAALGAASARECTHRGDEFACRCVEIDTETATYRASSWRRRGDQVVARQVSVHLKTPLSSASDDSASYYIHTWRGGGDATQQHSLDGVISIRPRGQLQTLSAQRVELSGPGRVDIDTARWHRQRPDMREASCRTEWPRSPGQASLAASSADLDDGSWRIRGFEIVGETPYLGDFAAERPGPVSGFLPPTLIYSREIASLQASYLLADWGVAPQVVAAPTYWYGLGFGLMSHVEESGDGPPSVADDSSMLDAQLRWTKQGWTEQGWTEQGWSEQAGGVRPSVLGDVFWGAPYTHVSASVEEVGDPRFWAVDRFRQDAPFRIWRPSRAGVSLSGPEHALSLRVLHVRDLDFWAALGGDADPWRDVFGANLILATHHVLDEHSSADFEVEHTSFVADDSNAHATTVRVGAERMVGSRGALYVRPALRTWLQTGLGSAPGDSDDAAPSGIDTATRSQFVAMVDAGAALRGRFGTVIHRVDPGIVMAREIIGFSRGDLAGGRDGTDRPESLIEREPGFSLGALRLDQELKLAPTVSLDMPLAVVFEGEGFAEAARQRPWVIGGFAIRGTRSEAGVRAACPKLCDEVLWTASAAAELGAFDVLYMGGDLNREVLLPLTLRSSIHDGWALIHGFQQAEAQAASALAAHLAGVGWHHGRFAAQVRGYYRQTHDQFGVSVGNSYAFPEFGWRVGARATVGSDERDWGILVGLSPSR
jgi:hypothetical protein